MLESVKNVLNSNAWNLATMSDVPNVVPVGMRFVTEDGLLLLGDVMMETSAANVKANGRAAVCAWDPKTSEGYQIKGSAVYETEGEHYDLLNGIAMEKTKGALRLKGVIVLTPEKTIVVTPGPDNKKIL